MDIPVGELIRYMPHRRPMVWIDRVRRFSKTDGECLIDVRPNALYMGAEGLRASSCLEFVAQSFGFIWTCYITRIFNPLADPMPKAMLVSFNDARFADRATLALVKAGDELRVAIENVRAMGPITAFKGVVWFGDKVLCEVQMRTFSE